MDIADLRAELGLSQQAFADEIGLASKGHVSQLERGEIRCSVAVALKIEALSGGRIQADFLNADVRRVRETPTPTIAAVS
jgi:transcriptional regulator with XRE-family HTH domain